MLDLLQLTLMRLLPKRLISRLAGRFAKSPLSKVLIPWFIKHYSIDYTQAEFELKQYPSLIEFFARSLKPGLRPVAEGEQVVTSPVDGVVSQFGPIEQGRLIQAKGVNFTVLELLGQDQAKAELFNGGSFVTIYLSPMDYHRIHSPLGGTVTASTYVPGTLFPVNPFGVRAVKGLFARNERLVTYLDTSLGTVALVKVGAIIVGSVKVNYSPAQTNVPKANLEMREYCPGYQVAKGDELGRFEFGSTVILLFPAGSVELQVEMGQKVLMGQKIGVAVQ